MIKHNDKILVVDVEETCWVNNLPPEGQFSEIIQIGWAWVELGTCVVKDKGQVFIKPVHSKISDYCTSLTGITQKMVKSGLPFDQACKHLVHKLGSRSRPWGAWGNDKETIDNHIERVNTDQYHPEDAIKSPFSEAYLNIQMLTGLWIGPDIGPRPGLEEMMKRLMITPCGPAHRADNDAWDAACVLAKILGSTPVHD